SEPRSPRREAASRPLVREEMASGGPGAVLVGLLLAGRGCVRTLPGMSARPEITNIAIFCDFENVALGVVEAKFSKFDIGAVLDRLLLKGSIVVKKAYCDWDRYKSHKGAMHEAAFEMIEIPHVRM